MHEAASQSPAKGAPWFTNAENMMLNDGVIATEPLRKAGRLPAGTLDDITDARLIRGQT